MEEVEVRVRPALKIEFACRIFCAWRPHQVGAPLDVGRDILEPGLLELQQDRPPVALFQTKVLDLGTEDVGAIHRYVLFHVNCRLRVVMR